MKVGYIRDSGGRVKAADVQRKALESAKCDKIYADSPDSKEAGLADAMAMLKSGDTLFVCQLDRLGKPIKGVIDVITTLESRGVFFVAIDDGVDTQSSEGRYLVEILANLVRMDKALNSERTQRSLRIAKEKGRVGGRPPALTEDQIIEARKLIDSGMPVRAVAKLIGSNHTTLYRLIGAKPVASDKAN
jgi:DNA invertase Pin-like site-specific DNA recombinase